MAAKTCANAPSPAGCCKLLAAITAARKWTAAHRIFVRCELDASMAPGATRIGGNVLTRIGASSSGRRTAW